MRLDESGTVLGAAIASGHRADWVVYVVWRIAVAAVAGIIYPLVIADRAYVEASAAA